MYVSAPAKCHLWTFTAIVLDFAVIALLVLVHRFDILLPIPKNDAIKTLQEFLPVFGALIGGIVAFANKVAVTSLVTAHAKRKIVKEGMTFAQLSDLTTLANGGVIWTWKRIFWIGGTLLLTIGFLTSAIVNSLSPTIVNWGITRQMPIISFSSSSGVTPNVFCEYGGGSFNKYGYGINCPIDTAYGQIYNAGITSFRGTFPVNSTRNGVSYPSDIVGLSGAVSSLTSRYARQISGNGKRTVLPSDVLDVCLPRMVITTKCANNLSPGQTFQTQSVDVPGIDFPKTIELVSLCRGGQCIGPRSAPAYSNGVIEIFQERDTSSGRTTVTLYSTGKYASDLGSNGIQCQVDASETMVGVRIIGGARAEHRNSLKCPSRPAPSALFLTNVTRLAEMSLVKMQGADGKLEAISYIPSGTSVLSGLEDAITRMVSIGATEMYGTIDADDSLRAQWSAKSSYTFQTNRLRLGVKTTYSLIFALSPGVLILLLIPAWLTIGFRREGRLGFNPLHPPCAAAAGMNRERLGNEVAAHSDATEEELNELDLVITYGHVTATRMGLDTSTSQGYVQTAYSPDYNFKGTPTGSPMSSPMPTPNINHLPSQYYHQV